ncbi:MAG TPA: PAS domain S-box protein, partial [Dehalococcoidia bacterium]|nr:PAS domain S-box protein [Dehalococcoidia bacterium]
QAEDALRESEARYRSLSESSPLGVYEATADGHATYFNQRALQMSGLPPEQLLGWGWSRHVHPDDRPIVEAAWRAATQDGRECAIEYRLQTSRGTIWVFSHALPIRRPDGTVEKYVGTIDNITERREAQEALRHSEQLFRATLESTADGIIVTRPLGELMYWNNRAAEMLAIPQSVLDSRSTPEFGKYIIENARDPEDLVRAFTALSQDEPVHTGTWTARDGRMFEAFAHPLHDPSGDLLRVWSIREVTEKHQAEMALRQSEARFRSLAEHTTDLVLGITGPGIIDYASPNCRTILGYAPEDMVGRNALDVVHEDDLPYIIEEFDRAAAAGRAVSSLLRARHGHHAGWRWFEFTANFYISNSGEQRAVVTARDVTARKLAEDALRESEERLRTVVNSAPLALVAVDLDERFVLAEGQGLAVVGVTSNDILRRPIEEVYEGFPPIIADIRRALAGEEFSSTAVLGNKVFETHLRPLRDERANVTGMIGVAYDVTGRVHAEHALRDSEETARALLNAPTDGAVLVDREGTILAMNETAERRFSQHAAKQGVEGTGFIGTCVFDIFPPDLRAQRRARNDEVFQNGRRRHFEDERDGVWTDVTIDPIRDAEGHVIRLAIFSRDITDRKGDEAALRKRSRELQALNDYLEKTSAELERSQEELREASEQLADLLETEQARSKTDTLTGALNHGAISEVIAEAIASDVALAVAMVDIDGMKAVNDTYGHQAGDHVLHTVAGAIARGGAITGRYGGDEFVVALVNADREEAEAYKAAVEAALREANVVDPESGARVPVVASVGIAMYPEDANTLKALIERADERMYEEKKGRKGKGNGLSSSRTVGDERAARMVGELVPLLTSGGTLDEKLRLVAHRLSVGAGYAGVNFDVLAEEGGRAATVSQNAFTKAPEEVIEAWNRNQRAGSNTGVGELLRQTRRPVIIDDIAESAFVTDEQKKLLLSIGILSGIVVPLFSDDDMVATMSVGSKELSGFGQNDVQFLTAVAGQVSAIIRMARLVEDLRRASDRLEEARDETVMLLAEAAEAHTQNGTRHFLNTRVLAQAIAVEMGLDEARVRELGQAAALHDVGKIHLPDALLSSPERLSPLHGAQPGSAAWESLQRHCVNGREFLARTKGFELAALVAYTHHEHWDGAGYPEGISGDAIPIESSIIAVADSLDAMMTESPYNPGLALDEAVAEIRACRGTQFCPGVVDALVRLYERGELRGPWDQDEDVAAA